MFTDTKKTWIPPTEAGKKAGSENEEWETEHFLMLLHYGGTLTPFLIFHMALHAQAQKSIVVYIPP